LKNRVQLITYVDRLAGNLKQLGALLSGPLADTFGGVHLLPFFAPIDGADAGFDPIDHTDVDSRLGDWNDVRALSEHVEVVADLIVNHISSASPQFKDFSENGANSAFAGVFLTFNRVFPMGARETDLLRIYRPRPGLPFINLQLETGERWLLWTTFTPQQVDIDVQHPHGHAYLTSILARFQSAGIRMIRLDAVGFMSVIYPTINSKGISCFRKPQHGAVAGVILFFTCVSAVVGPLAMGTISDSFGDPKYGFVLATGFAALLFIGLLLNWIFDPARDLLQTLDRTEYEVADSHRIGVQAHS
jgi:sucrose phosphorylase